jgi:signal recognition particle receptor subunit beta
LHGLLKEQELAGVPVLVLANKQDQPTAIPAADVAAVLKVSALAPRMVHVLGTSASTRAGIADALAWLEAHVIAPQDLPREAAAYVNMLQQMEDESQTQTQASQ